MKLNTIDDKLDEAATKVTKRLKMIKLTPQDDDKVNTMVAGARRRRCATVLAGGGEDTKDYMDKDQNDERMPPTTRAETSERSDHKPDVTLDGMPDYVLDVELMQIGDVH